MNKIHIISYSGGMGSFITADLVVEKFGRDNTLLLFADTKIEDEDLYRFLDESVKYLGVKIVKISDGRNPWEVFRDRKYLGNTRRDTCSQMLKRSFLDSWLKDNYTPDSCIVYVGIDYTEKHRIDNLAKRKLPWVYKAPMVDQKMILTKPEKQQFCRDRGIEPPRLYDLGFHHNNCGGFCVKAGLAQFKLLFEKMPERYEWHVQQERKLREEVPNVKPFLRKMVNGKQYYIWLEDYRDYLQSGKPLTDDESCDWGGCGCAID